MNNILFFGFIADNSFYLLFLVALIIISGVFGGIINFFMNLDSDDEGEIEDAYRRTWYFKLAKSIIIGLGGSVAMPVFLYLINSRLVKEDNQFLNSIDYLIFTGFCIIGAIFAKKFLTSISDNVLKLAKEAKKESKEAKEEVEQVRLKAQSDAVNIKNKIEEEKEQIEEVIDNIASSRFEVKTLNINENIPPQIPEEDLYEKNMAANVNLRKEAVANDNQKNQWGGLSERNDRKITGEVTGSDYDYEIVLKVFSTKPVENPLDGYVNFYLHNSFNRKVRKIKVREGIAKLVLYAYGSFTVGAVCDNGRTWLELDLAELPGVSEKFKKS